MSTSLLDLRVEHIFDVRVDFTAERCIFGPLPGGSSQGYTPVKGGSIYGPRLSGKVIPNSGADYATARTDGVIELQAHYMWEADDGTKMYIYNRGYLVVSQPGREVRNEQGLVQPTYFRFTPTFRVPAGPHDWLCRTVIVGCGERRKDPDHSIFRYYAVL